MNMDITNKPYQADEASLRIDAYLDMLGEDNSVNFLNAVPGVDEKIDPAVAIRVTLVCVEFDFSDKDDSDNNRQWKQIVATQTLIRELLMVMMDSSHCRDINVVGNYIYGIFSTPFKSQIDEVLETLAKVNSVRDLVSLKLNGKGIKSPKMKIGADYGAVLRTTFKKDDDQPIHLWNGARFKHLADLVDCQMEEDEDIVVTGRFKQNLKEEYQKYMIAKDEKYVANVKNIALKKWIEEHE